MTSAWTTRSPTARYPPSTTRSWCPRTSSIPSTAGSAIAACHWADPEEPDGEINNKDGGRGVYFQDPAGHYMEILTRPYGSGG